MTKGYHLLATMLLFEQMNKPQHLGMWPKQKTKNKLLLLLLLFGLETHAP